MTMPRTRRTVHLIPISGKDSLCTALVQKDRAPKLEYHYLFCDVGMELPETYAWLDKVEKKFGLHIHRIGKSLEGLMASQRTLPSFTSRFCTRQGKIEPIMEYIRDLDADEVTQYIGFRYDEKDRLPPPQTRADTGLTVYPLIEEKVDIGGVYKMLDSHDVLPPSFFWKRLYDEVYETVGESSKKFIEAAPPWVMSGLFSWRSRSNCFQCLAGDTEIVTADGIKKIKDVAGQEVEILVPKFSRDKSLSQIGFFKKCPIRSFGTDKLYKITMRRMKAIKVVYATANHRWLISPKNGQKAPPDVTTLGLKPGDNLRNLFVKDREKRRQSWVVESVEDTGRIEEVYCATVDGIGAFGLADGLMTGNCHFQSLYEWVGLLEHHPDLFERSEMIEHTYGNPESEFHTAMSKRIKLSVFTLNPTLSLPQIRKDKDRIFRRRVEETRKAVIEARTTTGAMDMLAFRSCGSYCGK